MPVTDLDWPSRLLAGGGPASPDQRVLGALGLPTIGQFDPQFTAIMDDVMVLARRTWLTDNPRTFAVSSLPLGGLEAFVTSLLQPGDRVAIGGGASFVAAASDIAHRYDVQTLTLDWIGPGTKLAIVPLVDGETGRRYPVRQLAADCHAHGTRLLVDATLALGAEELRVDDWLIDAALAGVEYALGAPSGMTLVTYSADVEALMQARPSPPTTSYLDLLQLQAYWSPERLNHHTAPTNLIYALREALRLVQAEGLPGCWARHQRVARALRAGLEALGLSVSGEGPSWIVQPPQESADEAALRQQLREGFGIHLHLLAGASAGERRRWRVGLLGPDATLSNVLRLLASLESVLRASGATQAAALAYGAA